MKHIVETLGTTQIYGQGPELWARHFRPSVVLQGNFINGHIGDGRLTTLAQVNDEATDAEFAEFWAAALEKVTAKEPLNTEAVVNEYAALYPLTPKKPSKAPDKA